MIYVTGAPGCGKTKLIVDVLTIALNGSPDVRVICLDLSKDLGTYLEAEGASVARVSTANEAARAILFSRIVCFEVRTTIANAAQEWLAFCAGRRKEREWYVCDEAELVFPHHCSDEARQLVKFARNDHYVVALATQRPQLTDGIVRSNAPHVCVFRADSLQFVENGCREFGDPEVFRPALDLPMHSYLYRARYSGRKHNDPLPIYNSLEDRAPFLAPYEEQESR